MKDAALTKAIAAAGSVSALADLLQIRRQAISQWKRVPASRVLMVERAVRRQVTRYELRPDLYPPNESALP